MGVLQISLFGGVHVVHDGGRGCQSTTRAVQVLLAYLLLPRRRYHSRASLLGVFWGDQEEESARNCLNTTLWRLRRVLEPPGIARGTYLTTTPAGEVGFNEQSKLWLDVEEFERQATKALSLPSESLHERDIGPLEESVRLYVGDVLDGVYDDWALRERERLRGLYLSSLGCLMRYHATHGAPERGIAYAEEILRHDPLREEIHRELMRLHAATGARAMAARQYDTCKRVLAEELGIEPMPETQALLATIKRSTDTRSPSPTRASADVNALTLELRGAAQSVERALTYLRDVVGRVEQALGSRSRRRPKRTSVDRAVTPT